MEGGFVFFFVEDTGGEISIGVGVFGFNTILFFGGDPLEEEVNFLFTGFFIFLNDGKKK